MFNGCSTIDRIRKVISTPLRFIVFVIGEIGLFGAKSNALELIDSSISLSSGI